MNMTMNFKTWAVSVGAAAAAACASPAFAISYLGSTSQPGTVVSDYAATGLASFDIDFASPGSATVRYRIDAADLAAPFELSAMLRNFTNGGIPGYRIELAGGSFAAAGSVTRQFGGSTQVQTAGGVATLAFNPAEFYDVEVGNALGTTAGTTNWRLSGLAAGQTLAITVTAVPEAGTWAMLAAGLAGIGAFVRRRG